MPKKIFTTIDGPCPFGTGCTIDSAGCRKCEWYFRQGTGTFFWCKHPPGAELNPKKKEKPVAGEIPKRSRPKKSEAVKPVKRKRKRGASPKKGKERPIKTIKQVTK